MTRNEELAKQVSQSGPHHDGDCADAAKQGYYGESGVEAARRQMGAGAKISQAKSTVAPFKTVR